MAARITSWRSQPALADAPIPTPGAQLCRPRDFRLDRGLSTMNTSNALNDMNTR
jgi:hypothetical protein